MGRKEPTLHDIGFYNQEGRLMTGDNGNLYRFTTDESTGYMLAHSPNDVANSLTKNEIGPKKLEIEYITSSLNLRLSTSLVDIIENAAEIDIFRGEVE